MWHKQWKIISTIIFKIKHQAIKNLSKNKSRNKQEKEKEEEHKNFPVVRLRMSTSTLSPLTLFTIGFVFTILGSSLFKS